MSKEAIEVSAEVIGEEIEPAFQRDCLACEFYEKCGPKPYLLA